MLAARIRVSPMAPTTPTEPRAVGRPRQVRLPRAPVVIALLLAWLLVGPRIPIVHAFGSSVRVEDVLLVATTVFVLVRWSRGGGVSSRVRGIGLVVIVSVLTAGVAVVTHRVGAGPALLYALRGLEYWVIYPALLVASRGQEERTRRLIVRVLAWATMLHVIAAALQVALGMDIGFSKFSLQRGAGLTAGPYELGAVCAALACLWLSERRFALMVVALAGLALSASRVSVAACVVGLVVVVLSWRRRERRAGRQARSRGDARATMLRTAAGAGVIAATLATAPVWYPGVAASSVERIESTSVSQEWAMAEQAADAVPVSATSADYQDVAYTQYSTAIGATLTGVEDASTMIRFFRWHLLLDAVGDRWLVGLGPSFAGPSVDGAYLRILVETGVVGLLSWLLLVRRVWAIPSASLHAVIATLLVGSVFIDLPFAMRPMLLFWAMVTLAQLRPPDGVTTDPVPLPPPPSRRGAH